MPAGTRWDDRQLARMRAGLATLFQALPVDGGRVYLTGYGMGGDGAWRMIEREPTLFAAAIPIAGHPDCRPIACDGDDHNCRTRTYPDPALADRRFAQRRPTGGRGTPVPASR